MKGVVGFAMILLILPACSALTMSKLLDGNIGYWMYWEYTSSNITITLKANTTGYLGLGFSPNGGMIGADIVTVTAQGGNVSIQDRHGVSTSLPLLDSQQDYKLLNSSIANGQIQVTFTRLLDTCDPNDMQLKPFTTKLIYSYGSLDASGVPQYHGVKRGSMSVYLLSKVPGPPTDTGIFSIDPIPNRVTVSNSSVTSYWCSVVQFPNVTNKSHIIEVQPIITQGNEDIVHHMLVYSCSSVNLSSTTFDCLNGDGGGNLFTCATLLAAWAVGGEDYQFPSNVGLPIGGAGSTSYVLIQTHYSNALLQSGRTDASYIRLKATQNLRQYDAGILETGVVNGIFVPPNVNQMLVSGYCTSDCLSSQSVPGTGINIFSVLLHSHLLGRRVTLRHIRPSPSTISVIADDPYYEFDYQDVWNLNTYFQVLPGDILQTVCTMSSASKNVATLGGFGTFQEMCLSFAFYYPKINLANCVTMPQFVFSSADSIYQQLGKSITSFDWKGGFSTDGFAGAKWSDQLTQAIQAEYFSGTCAGLCNSDPRSISPFALPSLASSSLPNVNETSAACSQTTAAMATTSTMLSGGSSANQARHTAFFAFGFILCYDYISQTAMGCSLSQG